MDIQKRLCNNLPLIIATVVIGVAAGTSSVLLNLFLDTIEEVFLHFKESNLMPVNIHASAIRRGLSVVAGSLIATVSWYLLQRKTYRPVPIKRAMDGQVMPLGHTLIHVLIQIFFVGTGGSVGRELAPREAGAAFAQAWARYFKNSHFTLNEEDRKMLIAAAAGAGFAGVYIAPITGAFFCLELLYKKINVRVIAVSLTMSAIATLIGSMAKGFAPYYLIGERNFSLRLLPFAAIVAPIMGLLGALFGRAIKWGVHRRPHGEKLLVFFPIIGLITGLIAAVYPQIMGNGRGIAQLAISTPDASRSAILALSFGLIAKPIVTLLTIRYGGYGGVLTPSISIGASLGTLLGMLYGYLMSGVPLAQCAIIGAVAFLTSSQMAPLMATFMLFEVCHLAYSAFLILGLTAAISVVFSKLINPN